MRLAILQDFFCLISPDYILKSQVFEFKRKVRNCLGHSFRSEHSLAHISLLQCSHPYEQRFLYSIDDRIKAIKSFNIGVKGLGVFEHGDTRTIYISIVNKNPVCEVFESLVEKKPSYTPHFTIASNLSLKDFDIVWPHLRNDPFSHVLSCTHVTVLKRHPGMYWTPCIDIPFSSFCPSSSSVCVPTDRNVDSP